MLHRDHAIKLTERGIFIAMHFANEDPAGWYVGKAIESLKGCGQRDNFWVNFSPGDYDEEDDVKVKASALTVAKYSNEWALVVPKDFSIE
jgi:hypothetical protein